MPKFVNFPSPRRYVALAFALGGLFCQERGVCQQALQGTLNASWAVSANSAGAWNGQSTLTVPVLNFAEGTPSGSYRNFTAAADSSLSFSGYYTLSANTEYSSFYQQDSLTPDPVINGPGLSPSIPVFTLVWNTADNTFTFYCYLDCYAFGAYTLTYSGQSGTSGGQYDDYVYADRYESMGYESWVGDDAFQMAGTATINNGSVSFNFGSNITFDNSNNTGPTWGGSITKVTTSGSLVVPLPDVAVTSAQWDQTFGGLNFVYRAHGSFSQPSSVALYWANGSSLNDKLSPTPFYTAQASNLVTDTDIRFQVPPETFRATAPTGTTCVLIVLNEGNPFGESNFANNVIALPDVSLRGEAVNTYSTEVLNQLLRYAGQDSATITSTCRTPEQQARIMFDNAFLGKSPSYRPPGQAVLAVYTNETSGLTHDEIWAQRDSIISDMAAEINTFDPTTQVSNHLGDPNVLTVADIAPSELSVTGKRFALGALTSTTVSRFLGPFSVGSYNVPYDPAFHLEIPQPAAAATPNIASADVSPRPTGRINPAATARLLSARAASANAGAVVLNDGLASISGTVSTGETAFTFQASAGQVGSFGLDITQARVGSILGDEQTVMYLLDSGNHIIASDNDDFDGAYDSNIDFLVFPASDTYTLVIVTYGNEPVLAADGTLAGWQNTGGGDVDFAVSMFVLQAAVQSSAPTAAPVIQSDIGVDGLTGDFLTYQITATNQPMSFAASELPAGLTLDPSTGFIMGTVTQPGVYTAGLSASNSVGSGSATLTLSITPRPVQPPAITSAVAVSAQAGAAFSYQIAATNSPSSFGASGLPAGLNVDPASGIISGTPIVAGTYQIALSAVNAGGTGTGTLTLTVTSAPVEPPTITSAAAVSTQVGASFSYQIAATNSPSSFGASGLPTGLNIDPASGIISGTPTAAGTYQIALSAVNAGGTGAAALILTVGSAPVEPPVITSAAAVTAQFGSSFSYQIAASNSPTGFNSSGLPAGLNLDSSSGLITGSPSQAGTFPITLSASNAGGTGSVTLTLTVIPALPLATLTATIPQVTAGSGDIGEITVSLSAAQPVAVTVKYTVKGTATNGTDYVLLSGSKKINAGKTSKPIKVVPLGDLGGASKKTVKITLAAGDGYAIGTASAAKVKILAAP